MDETQLTLFDLFSPTSPISDGEIAPVTPDIQAPEYPMSMCSRTDGCDDADIEAALAFDNFSEGSRTPAPGIQTPAAVLQGAPATPCIPNYPTCDSQPPKRLRPNDVHFGGGQSVPATQGQKEIPVQNGNGVQNTANFRLYVTKVGTGVPEVAQSSTATSSLTAYGPFLKECGLYNEAVMRAGAPGVPNPLNRTTPQQGPGETVPLIILKAHLSDAYEGHMTMTLNNAVLQKFQSLPPLVRDTICRMAMISGKNWCALD